MATKNGNPFDVDFAKFFENFTAPKFDVPQFDVKAIAALQQSNIDAIGEVNQVASAGLKAIAARQTEMVQGAVEESTKAAGKLAAVKADDRFDASAKLAKTAFDTAVSNFQELAELAVKSQAQLAETLTSVYTKNVDGLQAAKPAAK